MIYFFWNLERKIYGEFTGQYLLWQAVIRFLGTCHYEMEQAQTFVKLEFHTFGVQLLVSW